MSVEAMTWALAQKTGSVGHKAVLLAIADRAGFYCEAWPSRARLARETEQSERTVTRQLADLEERGFIERYRRYRREAGGGRTTDLIIVLAEFREELPSKLAKHLGVRLAPKSEELGDTGREAYEPDEGDLGDTSGRAYEPPVSPQEPSENHQTEPSGESELIRALSLDDFDTFWDTYDPGDHPKGSKGRAFTSWKKLTKFDQAHAMEGARRHGQIMRSRVGYTMPHASTWLNQRRWMDETPQVPPNTAKPGIMDRVKAKREAQRPHLTVIDTEAR